MPYIPQKGRDKFRDELKKVPKPENSGELNYLLTMIIFKYLSNKPCNYNTINDIMGALEGAKLEFYRRCVAPYEDRKKEENGDI